ncbi:MAG: haloacid dehalogenase-like hydrolase, partial [Parahaliea sp.]
MTTDNQYPLIVDLDGTLIRSDLLIELLMLLLRSNPLYVILVVVWLLDGKARLKSEIARRVDLPVEWLPYNLELLEYLRSQKRQGRQIVLATASHVRYARSIARHLRVFDDVLASDEACNLSGSAKRTALTQRYGDKQYVYAGNAPVDLDVWAHCHQAIVVASARLAQRVAAICTVELQLSPARTRVKSFIRALRVHQWVKNALILVPVLTAHLALSPPALLSAALAFLAFSFCASSVYFLNDLLDLNDDRRHATKKHRPFAA